MREKKRVTHTGKICFTYSRRLRDRDDGTARKVARVRLWSGRRVKSNPFRRTKTARFPSPVTPGAFYFIIIIIPYDFASSKNKQPSPNVPRFVLRSPYLYVADVYFRPYYIISTSTPEFDKSFSPRAEPLYARKSPAR